MHAEYSCRKVSEISPKEHPVIVILEHDAVFFCCSAAVRVVLFSEAANSTPGSDQMPEGICLSSSLEVRLEQQRIAGLMI